LGERSSAPSGLRPSLFVICNTPVEVRFTSAGCLNYPCRTPSIDSASNFFSLRFSSSRERSRLASDTSMPPYLAFQLYSVASEMPRSAAGEAGYLAAQAAAVAERTAAKDAAERARQVVLAAARDTLRSGAAGNGLAALAAAIYCHAHKQSLKSTRSEPRRRKRFRQAQFNGSEWKNKLRLDDRRAARIQWAVPNMSLLEYFEPLPLSELFFATLACVAVVGASVLLSVRLAVRLIGLDPGQPILIHDALIGSLSAIFALMVAFSAAGIWNDAIQARAAVQREANAIENVTALASHYPYGRRAIENDWPAMQHRAGVNETLYQRGNGPLVQLIDQIAGARGEQPTLPFADLLVTQLMDLRSARLQREVIARGGVTEAQWVALVTIAIAAMLVIAITHNHAFGLQTAAIGLYVLGVSAALFVILAHDRPFVGHSAVKPLPIQQAIDRMERSDHH
jgi:hypothetical protein